MKKSSSSGSRVLKYGFLLAVGIFVCYHFWPKGTKQTGMRIYETSKAAVKAGYDEATAAKGVRP